MTVKCPSCQALQPSKEWNILPHQQRNKVQFQLNVQVCVCSGWEWTDSAPRVTNHTDRDLPRTKLILLNLLVLPRTEGFWINCCYDIEKKRVWVALCPAWYSKSLEGILDCFQAQSTQSALLLLCHSVTLSCQPRKAKTQFRLKAAVFELQCETRDLCQWCGIPGRSSFRGPPW